MPNPTNSAQSEPIVSDERIRNVLREHLGRAINVERRRREEIASDSGVNIHQIDALRSREAAKKRPFHAHEMLSLAVVLGPRCVNAVLAVIGYAGASSLDDADVASPALDAVEMMENVTRFARCAADNRIDHTEEPDSTAAADNIIELALPYSSKRTAA